MFGVTFVSAMTNSSWLMSMSSSSPAIISSPVSEPVPCRIAAGLDRRRVVGVDRDPRVDLVLVDGPLLAYGLSAACALPAPPAERC